jgi:hypothetical protein
MSTLTPSTLLADVLDWLEDERPGPDAEADVEVGEER